MAREGEQLARQRPCPGRGPNDRLGIGTAVVILGQRLRQELGVSVDGGQQVVEVVGDPARQPTDRLHLLGLAELDLELLVPGDVACERRGAVDPAGLVAGRSHGQCDLEGPAGARPAACLQLTQLPPRADGPQDTSHLAREVFRSEERRRPAQDLCRRPAEEGFCRAVPARDPAGQVGPEDAESACLDGAEEPADLAFRGPRRHRRLEDETGGSTVPVDVADCGRLGECGPAGSRGIGDEHVTAAIVDQPGRAGQGREQHVEACLGCDVESRTPAETGGPGRALGRHLVSIQAIRRARLAATCHSCRGGAAPVDRAGHGSLRVWRAAS